MVEWVAVLKISLPVLLLDEILKFIARTWIDGKPDTGAAKARSVISLLAWVSITLAYFAWMLGPYAELINHALIGPSVDPSKFDAVAADKLHNEL